MSFFNMAVETVGREILFIKDNKVIGKGRSGVMYGHEWVSGEIVEGEIIEMVKDLENVKLFGLRHAGFHFSPFTGAYLGTNFQDLKGDEILDDVRIVDEFNFSFGICNKDFQDVEGYKSKIEEIDNSINTFSFRADCEVDVLRFEMELKLYDRAAIITRHALPLEGRDGEPVHVGELKVEVQTNQSMEELDTIMANIQDSHIMHQTLRQVPLKDNDLSRDYNR